MALPRVEALERLEELDRELLHVFVIGPGQGEGIALALPGSGWVLVDGCSAPRQRPRDRYPLEHVLRQFWGDDRAIEAMVLTHPHADHVAGFAELLESLEPKVVGVTGTNADDLRRTLADEAANCDRRRAESSTREAMVAAGVVTALRAINTWAEDHPEDLIAVHDQVELVSTSEVSVHARAPHPTLLQSWFDEGRMAEIMAKRANELSAVLEVVFGRTRIVLGGDLPVRDQHGPVPTGWNGVLERHGQLATHSGFKIPHHGSREALHPKMIRSARRDRAWLLTPFNSSSLPRLDDDDGLDMLLAGESPVMLTAPSVSKKLLRAHKAGKTTPADLAALTEALKAEPRFDAADSVYRNDRRLGPLDPLWCVAFDARGRVRARWRGKAALEVVR